MANLQRLNQVRAQLSSWFVGELGLDVAQPITESILVRDGYYCGRRFRCGGFSAVWFAEEEELKLYGRGGELLEVRSLEDHRPVGESQNAQPRETHGQRGVPREPRRAA
jgi:hypothetical protein